MLDKVKNNQDTESKDIEIAAKTKVSKPSIYI